MLNQAILVGRICDDDIKLEGDGDKKFANVTISVPRTFKNEDGIYETDYIDVILYNALAEHTIDYCKKGDLVGVKGRLQTEIIEDKKTTIIIADKVTFLSSKGKEDE